MTYTFKKLSICAACLLMVTNLIAGAGNMNYTPRITPDSGQQANYRNSDNGMIKSIASNKTASGRQANRRVEFSLF